MTLFFVNCCCLFVFVALLLLRFRSSHPAEYIFATVRKTDDIPRQWMNEYEKKTCIDGNCKRIIVGKMYTNDITNKRATNKITTVKTSACLSQRLKWRSWERERKSNSRQYDIMSNRVIQHMDTCRSSSKVSPAIYGRLAHRIFGIVCVWMWRLHREWIC